MYEAGVIPFVPKWQAIIGSPAQHCDITAEAAPFASSLRRHSPDLYVTAESAGDGNYLLDKLVYHTLGPFL